MRSRLRRDDSGQGMLPLMVLVAFSVLVILFSLLVPWGNATSEKSQTQTAADAAALAAAQDSRELWDVGTQPGLLTYLGADTVAEAARRAGCLEADRYARNNEAVLVPRGSCDFDGGGRVRVDVRAERTANPGTGLAEATATAQMDLDLTACAWSTLPPPLPGPPAGTGPPTFRATLGCGAWESEYELVNVPPYLAAVRLQPTDPVALFDSTAPRLVE